MSDINKEIAEEIEEERNRLEQEALKPKPVSRNEVKQAKLVWTLGVITIDILTAYLIHSISGFWYYSVLWVLAGAGGLLLSERYKERIGNNKEQLVIGEDGVKVSAISIFVMALLVGGIWVTSYFTEYLSLLIEVSVVALFFYHLWNSYNFQHKDDGYISDNNEAILEEQNYKRIRERHRASRLVISHKVVKKVDEEYRRKHGQAYDAALGKEKDPNG